METLSSVNPWSLQSSPALRSMALDQLDLGRTR
jgi:hypothetical protein